MFLRFVSLSLLDLAAFVLAQRTPPPSPSDMQTSPPSDAEMPALSDDRRTEAHRKPVRRSMPQYGSAPAGEQTANYSQAPLQVGSAPAEDAGDPASCPPSYKVEADRLQRKATAQANYIAALERQATALKQQIAKLRQGH